MLTCTKLSNALVEELVGQCAWGAVGAQQPVPIHEEVPIVKHEEPVMHMVVSCRAQAKTTKDRIPWVRVLGVDQHQPVRIERAKSSKTVSQVTEANSKTV